MRGQLNSEESAYTPLMTISEAARKHGISRNKLSEYIRAGKIPGYAVRGHVFVSAESVEQYKDKIVWSRRGLNFSAVVEGHAEGKSDYAISKELGLTRERVRQIRSKAGLPVNPRRPTLPKTLLEVFSGNNS
jgi:excisionase family DNA binding protein